MCNIAFQLVFQQCYETSSTVHRTFYRNISFVICGAFILGEGGKRRLGEGEGRYLWFNLFYLVLGVRYQLGHCHVSRCNIYFILLYFFSLSNVFFTFVCTY